MVHTLTYQEMGIFEVNPNFAIETWIAGRFIESFTFLIAYFLINKKVSPPVILISYFVISLAILGTIVSGYFPDCYVLGEGLTPFKKMSEYLIALILLISTILLYRQVDIPDRIKKLVIASMLITVLSELSFTLYHDMFGVFNIIGHILKIISFYLLYKAILEEGLTNPMELLNLKLLKSQEENLKKQELLIQQSRLTGAGEALNNIAHQWRQPLNALGLMIQDLEDAYSHGDFNEAYLQEMVENSMKSINALSETINRFTVFFSPSQSQRDFNVAATIENCWQAISKTGIFPSNLRPNPTVLFTDWKKSFPTLFLISSPMPSISFMSGRSRRKRS